MPYGTTTAGRIFEVRTVKYVLHNNTAVYPGGTTVFDDNEHDGSEVSVDRSAEPIVDRKPRTKMAGSSTLVGF